VADNAPHDPSWTMTDVIDLTHDASAGAAPAKKRKTADEQPASTPFTQVYFVEATYSTEMLEDYYDCEDDDDMCKEEHQEKFNTRGLRKAPAAYRDIHGAKAAAAILMKELVTKLIVDLHCGGKDGRYDLGEGGCEPLSSQFNMKEEEEEEEEDEEEEEEYGEDVDQFLSNVDWATYFFTDPSSHNPSSYNTKKWKFQGLDIGYDFSPECEATVSVNISPVQVL
jgi:hypothetical protein